MAHPRGTVVLPCMTRGACVYGPVVLPNEGETMERVTLRIPKQQIEEVEQLVETGEFPNRSEAIRSAVREMINEQESGKEREKRFNRARV